MRPYIGISCFTSLNQIKTIANGFPDSNHQLMIGLSASSKSLRNQPLKEKWQQRMVHRSRMASLMLDDPRFLNLIHYATEDQSNLLPDLLYMHQLAGRNLHGFQLNLFWPSIGLLEQYRNFYPHSVLVLNIFPPNLAAVDDDPVCLLRRLTPYLPFIDAVLIDASGGQGRELDPNKALEFIDVLSLLPKLTLGLAGGLKPDNLVRLLTPLRPYYRHLSIDIESGVRNENNQMDLSKAVIYRNNALALLH